MSHLILLTQSFFQALPFQRGDKLLVGFSGGIDSVVLADLCLKVLGKDHIVLAYFNHGLRSLEEQKKEKEIIEELIIHWKVKIFWGKAEKDLAQESRESGESLENLARHARYAFLREVQSRENIPYLATAHHGDDQVETFLMRLTGRGSWVSLKGIREKGEKGLLRPLLTIFRQEIETYAHENSLPFWEDSTNKDLNYLRNRFRHELLPPLNSIAPYAKKSLLDWQERLRELQDWLEPFLPVWEKKEEELSLPLKNWLSLPPFLKKELLLKGAQELFNLGLISKPLRLSASFLDSLNKKSSGILLKGQGIELRIYKFSIILKALLVKKQEISYLLRVEPCEWYSLPWGQFCLEKPYEKGYILASFDHRWDFWREGSKKGKKFFSQWQDSREDQLCLLVKEEQIKALFRTDKACLLWSDKQRQEEFKILADKGEKIGR